MLGRWFQYAFIIASNAVLVVYLLRDGVSAFEIMTLAAFEALVSVELFVIVRACYRAKTEKGKKLSQGQRLPMEELVVSTAVLFGVFGFIIALFPAAVWLVAQPEQPLFFGNPAFVEAVGYVALALLGQFGGNLVEALSGRLHNIHDIGLGLVAHLMIGVIAAAFGTATVLLLELPTFALIVLIVLKTAVDMMIARSNRRQPVESASAYGFR